MSYLAESYERYMVPALFGPWASHLVQVANPQPGERVLDLACGTGILTRRILPYLGQAGMIFAYDVNHDMLGVGRAAIESNNAATGWCQGRAEQLGFPSGTFDLVVCQFGLMLFAERHVALLEMRRVLRKGGRVVLSVWRGLESHPFYQTLHEVSQRRLGKSGVQEAFSLGDVRELRRYLTDAGFLDLEIDPVSITARFPNPEEFIAWEIDVDPASISCMGRLDPQAQHEILADIRKDMQKPLQEVMQEGVVVLPFHAYVASAKR